MVMQVTVDFWVGGSNPGRARNTQWSSGRTSCQWFAQRRFDFQPAVQRLPAQPID